MNIIHTLKCGCHRGLCECQEATHLHTAMLAARDKARQAPLFSQEYQEACSTFERCHNAYNTHFEQTEKRAVITL